MPDVSIITALAARPSNRLEDIHRALDAAQADWEWLVQVDGEAPAIDPLPASMRADPRVRVQANGRQDGIAVTRNRALARARSPLLLNADSDDVPVAGGLDRLAAAFADPRVGMAFGDWVEHWPDGGRWQPPARFMAGRQPAGTIATIWAAERWVPLHLAGAMWRTTAVLAAGGWTALAGGSDIGLMLGVDASWASFYTPGKTFTYHHHEHQVTAGDRWRELFEQDTDLLAARAHALGFTDRR
jgi:glycosyltransferase involved in cell wall biosynthesis